MSYPKTLGELWDMGPEAVEAWEVVQELEHEANERDEQIQWMRDTLQELKFLTSTARYQSERSPQRVREMVQEVLDECQADY